jgi:rhodanese-related sulfurtransferase
MNALAHLRQATLATALIALAAPAAHAFDAAQVPEAKRTSLGLYLDAKEAAHMKAEQGAKALFIDVRSRAEATFLGMSTQVDALMPYQEFGGEMAIWDERENAFGLESSLDFIPQVEALIQAKGIGKNSPIIVMCRSGNRSATAVTLLAKYGYTQVYSVVDGYEGDKAKTGPQAGQRVVNGWRNAGLPWSYKLDKAKVIPQ